VESIFAQLSKACRELKVSLCGGHTEITHGLSRPIISGHMLGEVRPDAYVTSSGAQVGDALILTKGIAVEGTSLIAREKKAALRALFSPKEIARCANFLHSPGISVVKEAQLAIAAGGVHALHDPTEGGVATGLWELSQAADVGVYVDQASLPVLPECQKICRHFGLDPLGLIGSGSLLIAAAPEHSQKIVDRIKTNGIAATVIGSVVTAEEKCRMRAFDGTLQSLPTFARDEITRLFD
jgi:hydrogenase maturation factor